MYCRTDKNTSVRQVPILNELLGQGAEINGDTYNFRCDDQMTSWRGRGFGAAEGTISPHGGGGQRARGHGYRSTQGTIFSGATRVVWELTGVPTGTCAAAATPCSDTN